jgi:hypothetical protein
MVMAVAPNRLNIEVHSGCQNAERGNAGGGAGGSYEHPARHSLHGAISVRETALAVS